MDYHIYPRKHGHSIKPRNRGLVYPKRHASGGGPVPPVEAVLTFAYAIPSSFVENGTSVAWTDIVPNSNITSVVYSGPAVMTADEIDDYFNQWNAPSLNAAQLSIGDVVGVESDNSSIVGSVISGYRAGTDLADLAFDNIHSALIALPSALVLSPCALFVGDDDYGYVAGIGIAVGGDSPGQRSFSWPSCVFTVAYP